MSSISCGRRPAEGGDVLFRHHRVVERVVLVVELDDRARQLRALLDAEPRRQRAGGDVAHHDFERDDLHLADQLLAHVEPPDEMGRNPDFVEVLEYVFGDPVVENAFTFDHFVFLGVEGGRVVLEVLNQRSRFRAFIEDLRLAFVNAAAATHRDIPWFLKVHGMPWFLFVSCRDPRRRDRTFTIALERSGHEVNLADRSGQHNRECKAFSTWQISVTAAAACCLDAWLAICKAQRIICVRDLPRSQGVRAA